MEDIGEVIALIKSLGKGGGGSGGTNDHKKLKNRNAKDQHPISAITGLQEALDKGGGITVKDAKVGQLIRAKAVDATGNITEYEPVPWGYEENGVSQPIPNKLAPKDWNENNSNDPAFVKNRPCWEETELSGTLIEPQVLNFGDGYGPELPIAENVLRVGFEVTTQWGDEIYVSTVKSLFGNLVFGNDTLCGGTDDTGEPFAGQIYGTILYLSTSSPDASINVGITYAKKIYHKLDKSLAPDGNSVIKAPLPTEWADEEWAKYSKLFNEGTLIYTGDTGGNIILSLTYLASEQIKQALIGIEGNYSLYTNREGVETFSRYLNSLANEHMEGGVKASPATAEDTQDVHIDENGFLKTSMIVPSSTSGSAKKFKITVDDSGAITATEVV